ncbi:MAG: HD domain-containing protein [Bacteroidetes bacterium]|nr:HD domain-containing protein [Bacteroidota bacterium]
MNCVTQNIIIDSILDASRKDLGNDFEQYRNHVYRVFNLAIPYVSESRNMDTLSVAAAFHDLGIWTGKTFDYLEPSIALARRYATVHDLDARTTLEIETIISNHHKLSEVRNSQLAEVFRQADLVDLSLGLIRCSRTRRDIRLVRKTFPNKGFHYNLFRFFLKNLLKNPLNPLPMYKL